MASNVLQRSCVSWEYGFDYASYRNEICAKNKSYKSRKYKSYQDAGIVDDAHEAISKDLSPNTRIVKSSGILN